MFAVGLYGSVMKILRIYGQNVNSQNSLSSNAEMVICIRGNADQCWKHWNLHNRRGYGICNQITQVPLFIAAASASLFPHPRIPLMSPPIGKDRPFAYLKGMFPAFADKWLTEADVINALLSDGNLRSDMVDLLNGWLEEVPFHVLYIKHPLLVNPIVYERGRGEEQLFRQLRERETRT